MIKIRLILTVFLLPFFGCESDNDDNEIAKTSINFTFVHKWGETIVTNEDFNTIQFTNAFGNELSIERLRYLISKIKLTASTGEVITLDEYTLVDLEDPNTLNFTSTQKVNIGAYTKVSFIFGFTNEDNIDGTYMILLKSL